MARSAVTKICGWPWEFATEISLNVAVYTVEKFEGGALMKGKYLTLATGISVYGTIALNPDQAGRKVLSSVFLHNFQTKSHASTCLCKFTSCVLKMDSSATRFGSGLLWGLLKIESGFSVYRKTRSVFFCDLGMPLTMPLYSVPWYNTAAIQ